MDFSTISNHIYTKEQMRMLVAVLDESASYAYKTGNQSNQLKSIIPHQYEAVLTPFFAQENWSKRAAELKEYLIALPVITLSSPYTLTEKSVEKVAEYVRENIAPQALIELIFRKSESPLSIEWNGTYGEF